MYVLVMYLEMPVCVWTPRLFYTALTPLDTFGHLYTVYSAPALLQIILSAMCSTTASHFKNPIQTGGVESAHILFRCL